MKILYILYQIFIALPILLVLTLITALITILGSWLGNAHFWGKSKHHEFLFSYRQNVSKRNLRS